MSMNVLQIHKLKPKKDFKYDIAVGPNKGHTVTRLQKNIKKEHTREQPKKLKFVRSFLKRIVGFTGYEKRAMEELRLTRDRKSLKVLKKRLGDHTRAKKKREVLHYHILAMRKQHTSKVAKLKEKKKFHEALLLDKVSDKELVNMEEERMTNIQKKVGVAREKAIKEKKIMNPGKGINERLRVAPRWAYNVRSKGGFRVSPYKVEAQYRDYLEAKAKLQRLKTVAKKTGEKVKDVNLHNVHINRTYWRAGKGKLPIVEYKNRTKQFECKNLKERSKAYKDELKVYDASEKAKKAATAAKREKVIAGKKGRPIRQRARISRREKIRKERVFKLLKRGLKTNSAGQKPITTLLAEKRVSQKGKEAAAPKAAPKKATKGQTKKTAKSQVKKSTKKA